ncbi:RnfABCDGE type electron transport complex subunit D [Ilyobacter polytropus]|uniref:NQR2 and RnfD family protein n=1 Tax=Ilyobacter polytropus (strain ATCC 51220 / DSM 2926 / LMG 16218 / CuHBu1) TaxID=572544 RepID=E3HBG2_ILYPC|nr:NQR2 and RnfD family protein [Ilyobacter polytropus DSM 2926]
MFQKQIMMRKVMYSLIPIFIISIYLYGLKAISLIAVSFFFGITTEYFFLKKRNKKVTEAVLVTCALYSLSMPPGIPLWIAAIGIIFGVSMGKMAYGGFGRNIFNPAITGRLFIYIAFPNMANKWLIPGNFGLTDGTAGATPLEILRNGGIPKITDLLLGTRPGSLGESSGILIIIAAIYLLYTKTASWRSMGATLIGYLMVQTFLYYFGLGANPLYGIFSGSLLFISIFMVTDPVSSPKKNNSLFLYGFLIGLSVALIRSFSLFPEGTSFAILLGNTFAPLMDEIIGKVKVKEVKS